MKKVHFILAFSVLSFCSYAQMGMSQLGTGSYSGDGGAATAAHLNQPRGVAVDAAGNIYIADFSNNLVRKVDAASGIISTVAGKFNPDPHKRNGALAGNGGPATDAQLDGPASLAIDAQGNLYIADFRNEQIRKIDASGKITAYAGLGYSVRYQKGTGLNEPALTASIKPTNLAFDAAGNLMFSSGGTKIYKVDEKGNLAGVAGMGTNSNGGYNGEDAAVWSVEMDDASGITADKAGNVYYCDAGNMIVRKIDMAAGKVNTVAGWFGSSSSSNVYADKAVKAGLAFPADVIFDADGNMLIADCEHNLIRKVDAKGNISTFAGGGKPDDGRGDNGPATSAKLNGPCSMAFDHAGNLYIAERKSNLIRKIDKNGVITTVAGTTAAEAPVGLPPSGIKITVFAGNAYFSSGNTGDGGPASVAKLHNPSGIAIDAKGNIYVADTKNNVIRKIDNTGIITTIVGNTSMPAGYSGDGGPASAAAINEPTGLAIDKAGNLCFCDRKNHVIRKVDQNGNISTIVGTGKDGHYSPLYFPKTPVKAINTNLSYPDAIAFDSHGNLYIADGSQSNVFKVTTDGVFHPFVGTGTYGYSGDGGPAKNAQVHDPCSIAVNAEGEVFIGEGENGVIRKVDKAGIITTICGQEKFHGNKGDGGPANYAELSKPTCIIFDSKGNLYFADYRFDVVRKIDTQGNISCVLTNHLPDYEWNERNTEFPGQDAIAFDADGNLYFTDFQNNIVRKISGL